MPLNFETIKTSLYSWATANSGGASVIFLNENAPRPAQPYVTLFLSSLNQIGEDYTPESDVNGLVDMVGDREFTLQIQTYGGDCITRLENLRSSLQMQTVLDTLRANGIVFVNHFGINDLTELLDSRFEKRGAMDVLFRIGQNYTDNLGLVETIEVEEIYQDAGGTVVYDRTITIP
jgi:hypothetical protein